MDREDKQLFLIEAYDSLKDYLDYEKLLEKLESKQLKLLLVGKMASDIPSEKNLNSLLDAMDIDRNYIKDTQDRQLKRIREDFDKNIREELSLRFID